MNICLMTDNYAVKLNGISFQNMTFLLIFLKAIKDTLIPWFNGLKGGSISPIMPIVR